MAYEYELCDNCGGHDHFAYHVNDDIWKKLPGQWNKSSVLCMECFLSELERFNPDLQLSLEDFKYLSFFSGNNKFGGIIKDYENEVKR